MAYQNVLPFKIINAASMAASITSAALNIQLQDNVGIQLIWTGVPVGTFDVQVSVNHKEDAEGNILVAGTWTSLPLSPNITASGTADNAYIDINQISAPYIRIVYTKTSGSGTLNAHIVAKAV